MAITSCTGEVFRAFYGDDVAKGFFHGHTYTANPLACTAALAGLELLASAEIQAGIQRISESHSQFLDRMARHPKIRSSRQCGVILALDLDLQTARYGNIRDQIMAFFMERGVFLRPLGNTVYLMPPYVITREELDRVYDTLEQLLQTL